MLDEGGHLVDALLYQLPGRYGRSSASIASASRAASRNSAATESSSTETRSAADGDAARRARRRLASSWAGPSPGGRPGGGSPGTGCEFGSPALGRRVVLWGMNAGVVGFVAGLARDELALKRIFSPIPGITILVGLGVMVLRLVPHEVERDEAAAA